MKQLLEKKTKQIVDIVAAHDLNNVSILSGNTGSLFLLCYYAEYTKNDHYREVAEKLIIDMHHKITEGQYYFDFGYSNGLSGYLWALNNLINSGYIELDLSDYFSEALPPISNYMFEKMEEGNYDFLHGALGPANLLVDIIDVFPNNASELKRLNKKLLEKSIYNETKNTLHFVSTVTAKDNEKQSVINLSLSHGMASIIYYLVRCLKNKEVATPEIELALKQIINYYKTNQNVASDNMSFFPSWVKLDGFVEQNSRLAWCYGDIGIGMVLYEAGIFFNDSELKSYALEILKLTAKRRDPIKENVIEGNFCHGASGLVEIYTTIYDLTKDELFLETAKYWLQITLDLATYEDGFAGYKTDLFGKKEYQNNCTLLEGVAGIGLVFLENLMDKSLPWKKALML